MPSWITNDPASKQVRKKLIPTDNRPPDGNVYCYRPNGELYVVVPRSKWKRLREQGKLESFLSKRRARPSRSMND